MLTDQKVVHKKFGNGVIRALEGGFLIVEFGQDVKKLIYPQAFDMGLSLCDAMLMQQIKPEVEKELTHQADKRRREERFYRDKAAMIKKNSGIAENMKQARIPAGNVAFKCNRDMADFEQWALNAGVEQKTGKIRRLMQTQPGKLCIMTTQDEGEKEADRYIFAMFIMDEAAVQSGKLQGRLEAAADAPKVWLQPQEAKSLRFWDYYSTKSGRPAWGSGAFRYIDDNTALALLEDAAEITKNTPQEKEMQALREFYTAQNSPIGK